MRTMVLMLGFLWTMPAHAAAEPDTPAPPVAAGAAHQTPDEQSPVAVPDPSALALQYYRTGNWVWAVDELWTLAVPLVLLFTGASARLRDVSRRFGRSWFFTVGIYVALYTLIVFMIDLPLSYFLGFVRQHAYGLSNQSFPKWFGDAWKRVAVSAAVGFATAWVPYLLLARSPRRWWLYTTIATIPFLFAVMLLKPIWVDPLFNRFGPMDNKDLETKILALAGRAGIDRGRIYQVDKSVDTKAVNAYVTGLAGTHRIVLWDTLLARLDDNQVLAVMGHEMGHYVLGHVPRSVLLSAFITLAGLFWVDRAGRWLIRRSPARLGFDSLADVASVPLLVALLEISSLLLGPVANVYSRYQEHEADQFTLELTGRNRSAALAFVKLQQSNLSNPRPGLFYKIWRSTHPSIAERIEFCNSYHPQRDGLPMRFERQFRP